MNVEPGKKAEGYYALAKRMNHRHERTDETVQEIDKQFREQIRIESDPSKSSRFLIIVRDALMLQIKKDKKFYQQYSDREINIQQGLLDELLAEDRWVTAIKQVAREIPDSSLEESLRSIDYHLSMALCDIANEVYGEHGNLRHLSRIRGGESEMQKASMRAILERAIDRNRLQAVDLTSEEERALKRFYSLSSTKVPVAAGVGVGEPADIAEADIYDLKESALEKIRVYFSN